MSQSNYLLVAGIYPLGKGWIMTVPETLVNGKTMVLSGQTYHNIRVPKARNETAM